jgi:hypothetical protein
MSQFMRSVVTLGGCISVFTIVVSVLELLTD